MEVFVQGATILSPIIAVLLAYWTAKSSVKDTAKKIDALEESTRKQVESMKTIARLQVDVMIKRAELEAGKTLFFAKQAQQEAEGLDKILNSQYPFTVQQTEKIIKDFQNKKPERDYILYCKFIDQLEEFQKRIAELKKELD